MTDANTLDLNDFTERRTYFTKEEILRLIELIPETSIQVTWWLTSSLFVRTILPKEILLDKLSYVPSGEQIEAEFKDGYLIIG